MVRKVDLYSFLLLSFVAVFSLSCESDIARSVAPVESKVWVSSVVCSDEEVRLYLGNTSGMNSGDIAQYRDDATVFLYVNSDIEVKLDYVLEDSVQNKGYYFKQRLADAKSGDILSFEAWMDGSKFGKVSGKTYIPNPVQIDSVNYITIGENSVDNSKKINLNIYLKEQQVADQNQYYQVEIENLEYSDEQSLNLINSSLITPSDGLVLGYGQTWNKYLNSILVRGDRVANLLSMDFDVHKSVSNKLKIRVNTITPDYYNYAISLDNGGVYSSNIHNGVGIFSGVSGVTKRIRVN